MINEEYGLKQYTDSLPSSQVLSKKHSLEQYTVSLPSSRLFYRENPASKLDKIKTSNVMDNLPRLQVPEVSPPGGHNRSSRTSGLSRRFYRVQRSWHSSRANGSFSSRQSKASDLASICSHCVPL